MKRLLFLVAILAMGMASSAFAADYGMAGCGLGAMAFKDQPGKIQIVAATLNNLISPQTSAITSGTSNCVGNPQTASAMFITVNQQALRTDISRGNGESIASLSKILNCSDADQLGTSLQKNYSTIFPAENTSATQINDSIRSTIKSDSVLSKECAI
jgi:hypothetical protein